MAKQSNGKKKARVWYSKGNPNGMRKAKGQAYAEDSVQRPTCKRKRRGF